MKIKGLFSNTFQTAIILIIIGAVFLAGLVLTGVVPSPITERRGEKAVDLEIWGFFPSGVLKNILTGIIAEHKKSFKLTYVEKPERSYEQAFVNALASGEGPDILIITQDFILKHQKKFFTIPFETFDERSFRDLFVDEAELYVGKEGILGVPFLIDPVVMYYNKDLFAKSGIAAAPRYWDEFLKNVEILTEIDRTGNILQSGTALGEEKNVRNVKEILSAFIMQGGNPIVDSETLKLNFGEKSSRYGTNAAENALLFYADFANPSKLNYSWNRALPDARDYFASGRLATYFGYASELEEIRIANPHLNFDVATMPQIRDFPIQATFGRLYALVVPKNSTKTSGAVKAAFVLANSQYATEFEKGIGLPSAHRNILAKGSLNPDFSVFYKAAVQSRGWLEPDPQRVDEIFADMIESVVTGQKDIKKAVSSARALLDAEIRKISH